jgi:DNA uptake protein ComE-like DNA-binding protein
VIVVLEVIDSFHPIFPHRAAPLAVDSVLMARADSFFYSLDTARRVRRADLPEPVLAPFDPNTADSARLVALGLQPWIARNIVRYRSRGGFFRKPADLLRIYGLDSASWLPLEPYIRIDTARLARLRPERRQERADSVRRDTFESRFPVKFDEPVMVDINSADSALLRRVPGIGEGYARLIIGLRERLGGFHSVDQLGELGGVPDSTLAKWRPWLVADRSLIRPININRASLASLRAHPYLNYYQARVIIDLRRKFGRIDDLGMLPMHDEFGEADMERLRPYIVLD